MIFEEYLVRTLNSMFSAAAKNLKSDGFVATSIIAVTRSGKQSLTVLQGEPGTVPYYVHGKALLVPPPMSQGSSFLRDELMRTSSEAAFMTAEYWTFPHDDVEAMREYMSGIGVPPSQHERRQEGFFVACLWPRYGFSMMRSNRIVRGGGHVYARPWEVPIWNEFRGGSTLGEESLFSFMTSWLEECLPGPDAGRSS